MLKGKISDKEIAELKKLGFPIYRYSVDKNNDIIFRPMTNKVIEQIRTTVLDRQAAGKRFTDWDAEELIFDHCVVWPEIPPQMKHELPAGIFTTLAKAVREKSYYYNVTETGKVYGPDQNSVQIQDYEFWPEITEEELAQIKASTRFQLHRLRIGRWYFVIRPMTRADLAIAAMTSDDQLTIVKQVTMWPFEVPWEILPTGVIENIGLFANDISGVATGDIEIEEL